MCGTYASEDSEEPGGASHPLEALFAPRSIAVVGVTTTPGTVPYDIFANILRSGYPGKIFPVAPGKRTVCDVPAYRYVLDIEEPIDLAVIVFPAEVVDRALEHCGRRGVRAAIVISAGFREVGAEGARREQRLRQICAEYGIRILGPNCLGLINTDPAVRLNASFARAMPRAGRIAFLSQSGALCTAVLDYTRDKQIGFSKFVSFGNKVDIDELDLLDYLHTDPATSCILLYLEELNKGRQLVQLARRITQGPNAKPVFVIKAGRTLQGARAAASHTGSLASEDAVCDAVFAEAGIVRAETVAELFDAAMLYTEQPLAAADRLAIVTNAGGPGVMATDAAIRLGLEMATFADETTLRLKRSLPATANIQNPVDVIGDARADRYRSAVDTVLSDPQVSQLLVILTPQSMTDIEAVAATLAEAAKATDKPMACSFMGETDVAAGIGILRQAGVPHYPWPERAIRAMASLGQVRRWRQQRLQPPERRSSQQARAEAERILAPLADGVVGEHVALQVLAAYGLPTPVFRLCRTADDAVRFARDTGFPVALRVVSKQIIHRSEAGGVALDIENEQALREAFGQMIERVTSHVPEAEIDGLIVRPMIAEGYQVIVGGKRDPAFGPVLMVGTGGVLVELLGDVAFALAPVSEAGARQTLGRTKVFHVLSGLRGRPPGDVEAVVDCLVRLGEMLDDLQRVVEVEVNPLIVAPSPEGAVVADVRLRLGV